MFLQFLSDIKHEILSFPLDLTCIAGPKESPSTIPAVPNETARSLSRGTEAVAAYARRTERVPEITAAEVF